CMGIRASLKDQRKKKREWYARMGDEGTKSCEMGAADSRRDGGATLGNRIPFGTWALLPGVSAVY
ncbi:MAG: hypothetical protein WBP91_16905, partial [Terriglobales bacterium]